MKEFLYAILLSTTSIIFISCASKKPNPPLSPVIIEEKKTYILEELTTKLKDICHAKVQNEQNQDTNNSILIQHYETYIKINLDTKGDFKHNSYTLTIEAEDKLNCIIPPIEEEKELSIQIVGYAKAPEQHLSDERAISVAELFFNSGIRHEIYAKGCLETKQEIDTKKRTLSIYLYPGNQYLKNHCE